IVQDVETTITALNQGSNKEKGPYLFEGKVDRTFKGQRTTQALAQELLTRSRSEVGDSQKYRETLYALAEFYCMGYEMDWSMMFANPRSNQINLPTYPFSKEKYWVERKEKGRVDAPLHQGQSTVIHPLLHRNTSDLLEQRFSSTFTGKDPFIKDSFRNGQRILHDYVFLEMARAAVIHGAGGLLESNTGILLKHITWENPLLLTDDPEDVHVGLNFQGDGDIVFEIYSKRLDNNNGFFLTHSVGSAEITSPSVMPLKIEDLYKICNNATYSFEQLRTEYNGIDARFDQVIDEVHIGDEQLLVKISSWPTLSIGFDQFIFEPSWMDAIVGLLVMLKVESSHEFLSLKEFEVYNTLKFTSWVYIRRIKDIELGLTNKISIDFYDNEGNILVRMVELELAARLKEGGGYSYEKPPENDANNSKIIIAPPPGIGNRRPEMKGLSLEQCVEWDLKELAGKILKLSKEILDIDSNLSEFGFDSINLAEFSKLLTDHYQIDVTPAVFFGHSTLEKLRQYFILEHRGVMEAFYREGVNVVEEKGQQEPIVLFEPRKKRTMNSRFMKNRDESNIP
ncbi:polyketide synthase dehydratase domain-containing protein, partial [Paenibacillus alba]|uniref:phosphopantetheine-binding protein n=1 Tax=Paenibacillus alba TaxID=1197127 RepID=UPI001567C4D8